MPERPSDPVAALLARSGRRIWCRDAARRGAAWLLVVLSSLAGLAALRWLGGASPVSAEVGVWVAIVSVFGIVVFAISSRPTNEKIARELDALPGVDDRMTTALALGRIDSPLAAAAGAEIRAFAAAFDPPYRKRTSIPRALALCLVPLAAIVLLLVADRRDLARSSGDRIAAAGQLDRAAETVRSSDPSASLVAEALDNSAAEIRNRPVRDPDDLAVRSLALAADALRRLANEAREASRDLAAAGAAGASDATGGSAAENEGDSRATEAGAQDSDDPMLREAAEHAESRTRPAPDFAEAQARASARAARLLAAADAIDSMRRSASMPGDGSDRRSAPDRGSGERALSMLDPDGEGGMPGSSGDADLEAPGGPGSDMDSGSGDLFGASLPTIEVTGPEETAKLDEVDGASAAAAVISTDGAAASGLEYRTAYEAAAAEAASAVANEEIPASSREIVRRYFEGIRPAPPR